MDRLFAAYQGEVRPEADFVLYWFAKAGAMIREGRLDRAGFVATNSMRGGANRASLERAVGHGRISEAWSDQPGVLDGAAVRVSMICFDGGGGSPVRHEGQEVEAIHSDLTLRRKGAEAFDLTRAARPPQNAGVAFMGDTNGGSFDIPGELAREWLLLPLNPNGLSNADVLRPWKNGMDVARRPAGKWIIDFGSTMTEAEAALYKAPFGFAATRVKPPRVLRQATGYAARWSVHERPRPELWAKLDGLARYIVTPTVAKHRLFGWLHAGVCADHQLIAIARDDDTTFGILHSRFHELWALRMGTSLKDRPRYTPSTTFETFPLPEGLTPDIPAAAYAADPCAQAIAAAAARLNELRENWLNPPDLVQRVAEVVPGYPNRILPVDDKVERELKKRTLTNLYNARPVWLDHAHKTLDEAVAEAYGWGDDWRSGVLTDDGILSRLFRLNQTRAAAQGKV